MYKTRYKKQYTIASALNFLDKRGVRKDKFNNHVLILPNRRNKRR